MDRRSFLRLGVGGAALLAAQPVLGRDPALAAPAPGAFGYGVASGDPMADRVILWTRVTPSPDATPGSGLGAPTPVAWEVAADEAFASIVASGSTTSVAASDHTVKVDAAGLAPATTYWYRFRALGEPSPVGRTRTAPAPGDDVDLLRIGLVSCSNWEGGWFSAYRHLAARDDLDVVFHLGDYVYEYGKGAYGPGAAFGRIHDPEHEMVSLADYRRRHALYKTDDDLRALHLKYAMVSAVDDHEVTDNSWSDGAVNHQAAEGPYAARRERAMQAYAEWMPIRLPDAGDITRTFRAGSLGRLADLFVLDERTYRSAQPVGASGGSTLVTSPEPADPARTMLGDAQRTWFEDGLAASTATWKLVINPVMFSPLVIADLPDLPEITELLLTVLAAPGLGLPLVLNGDQWDGYAAEQAALRGTFAGLDGVVLLTGDIHSSWASEVPADPGAYLPGVGGATVAIELVTPAVTSDGFDTEVAKAGVPGGAELAPYIPALVETATPWFKYCDVERHGYAVLEVTPQHVQWDCFHISDRTDRNATQVLAASFASAAGTNKLVASTPLGPRPAPPAVAPPTTVPPPTGGREIPATGSAVPTGAALAAAGAALATATLARRAASAEGDQA
jgi:alkaline phosphatase D